MKQSLRIILCCIALISLHTRLTSQPAGLPYPNSRQLKIEGHFIHFRQWMPETPARGKVVFVHGFCGSTFNFRNNIDSVVSAGYEVVAVDIPGFGYSERDDEINQSQSNRSRLLWMLLDSISGADTSGWNLVGHSMGGGTVEAMAVMHPEKTRSLTIIDGMLLSKGSAFYQSFFSLSRSKKRNEILESITEKKLMTYKNIEKKLKSIYGHDIDSTMMSAYMKPLEIPGTSGTIVNIITNAEEITSFNKEVLNYIPMLVVWGKNDKTIRLSNGKRFKREFPSVNFYVIPEAWHVPNETNPKLFNSILISFLDSKNI